MNRTGSDLSLALILDSSGSMRTSDPAMLRIEGAKLVVDMLPDDASATIIDFDHESAVLVDLAVVGVNRTTLKQAAERIDAVGNTDIGQALAAAARTLRKSASPLTVAILLTDGKGGYQGEIQPFVQNGWRLYTIGLGAQINIQLLSDLAYQTGGQYFKATTADDLGAIFDMIMAELSGAAPLAFYQGAAKMGNEQSFTFNVDDAIEGLHVLLNWTGPELGLRLVDPSGEIVAPAASKGRTYHVARVRAPEAGAWKALIRVGSSPTAGGSFRLQVSGVSRLRPQLLTFPTALAPEAMGPVELVLPTEALDPASVTVQAERLLATGAAQAIPMYVREQARQVLIRGEVPANTLLGDHRVRVMVRGRTAAGRAFQRYLERTYTVTDRDVDLTRLKVLRVYGAYLDVSGAQRLGLRPGLAVQVTGENGGVLAQGTIISVLGDQATVELQTTQGAELPGLSSSVTVDEQQWRGDQQ